MQKEDVVNAIRDWLDEKGFHYRYDAENDLLVTGISIGGKLNNLRLTVNFFDPGYNVYAISPIHGDPARLDGLMNYLHQANYGLHAGNFELDVRDGEIRFKFWVPTVGLESLPEEFIHMSILLPGTMFERYGDGIAALAMGFSDPDAEIKKAEEDDGEDEDGGGGD